jgi:hypothetical protein
VVGNEAREDISVESGDERFFTMKVRYSKLTVICAVCFWTSGMSGQTRPIQPITVTVHTASYRHLIPDDFVGLGFETASELPNHYGVSGYFFTPTNKQLITLFQNIGVKEIRVGGGTVDGSGRGGNCATPAPTHADIDHLFQFAQAAGIKVLYSFRLLNPAECNNPHLASDDASAAAYIWNNYRSSLDYFAIGNEPDVRSFHSYPGHPMDPEIREGVAGGSGSAYPSYLAAWRSIANTILKSVPEAKFAGPDTAVSATSSFTPNPSTGISWTQKFIEDERKAGIVLEATQHHYVWGNPGSTTSQEAIDDMLSNAWDKDTSIGTQPADRGGTAEFHPYPFVYSHILAPLANYGVSYRMTEANDCLHGVEGASNGFAAALWALDYMHWWAAHGMAGVNFHNNPWIPTDTIVPNPNPCSSAGCGNYSVTPKGYGMEAFALGSHGYVEPVTISNPHHVNLTAYAVGDAKDMYVTIINKTHTTTHDVTDAAVEIHADGFRSGSAEYMVLTDGDPGNAALMTATLGGASIRNDVSWQGKWTSLGEIKNGMVAVTAQSTTAVIVKIHAAEKKE